MPIFVDNVEAFGEGLDAVFESLNGPGVIEGFQALGNEIADTAKTYAPEYHGPPREGSYFEPGHLKEQINARAGKDLATGAPHVSVGAPWYVGGFMEYGTEHNAAHPFMRPTADDWTDRVEGEIASILAGEVQR